jgi:hypothetical protein
VRRIQTTEASDFMARRLNARGFHCTCTTDLLAQPLVGGSGPFPLIRYIVIPLRGMP